MRILVAGDAALGRALGVSRQAVRGARLDGRVEVDEDGYFDVLEMLERWRESTDRTMQRTAPPCLRAARLRAQHVAGVVERARQERSVQVQDDDVTDPVP